MKRRPRTDRFSPAWLAGLALGLFLLTAGLAQVRGQARTGQPAARSAALFLQANAQADVQADSSRPVAGAPEQAADTEGLDAYRMSPSVRLLGRWLGLGPNQAANLFEALNFAIVALTLLYFAWKYLPKMVEQRKAAIQSRLTEARTATEEAHRRLASIEQRLSRLDGEIGELRLRSEREAAEDEERFKASVEKERTRIVQSAEREIAAAGAAAQRELRLFAGRIAIERAERNLTLREGDDRRLIHELAQELGGQGRNGGRN